MCRETGNPNFKWYKWSTWSILLSHTQKNISEVQRAFYKSTKDYLIPAWCIKEKWKLNAKDAPRFAHITWTKWIQKRGCLLGYPQAYTLESPWIFIWGALGIPKLEPLPLLLLLMSRPPRSLNTSPTQNLTENSVRSISIVRQITTLSTVANPSIFCFCIITVVL